MASAAVPGEVKALVAKLEEELARLRKSLSRLEVLKAVTPLLSGVVVVVVGYFLTGSINNAIQKQQLELSNVKEMRDLLLKLGDPNSSREEVRASAITLSAFGAHGVAPLINLLQSGGETRTRSRRRGLSPKRWSCWLVGP